MIGKIVFAGIAVIGISVISDLKDRIKKLEAEAKEDESSNAYLYGVHGDDCKEIDRLRDKLGDVAVRENDLKIELLRTKRANWYAKGVPDQAIKGEPIPGAQETYDVLLAPFTKKQAARDSLKDFPWECDGDWPSDHAYSVQEFYDDLLSNAHDPEGYGERVDEGRTMVEDRNITNITPEDTASDNVWLA